MASLIEKFDMLDCPVCYKRLRPPIQTCENGHGICNDCRKSLTTCGMCRKNFTNISNTLLNQVVEKIPLECKYSFQGCEKSLRYDELVNHEKFCSYRKENCPLCYNEFLVSEINDHLKFCLHVLGTKAMSETTFSKSTNLTCKVVGPGANSYTYHSTVYITNIKTHFLWRRMSIGGKFISCVQYLGKDQENAGKYKFQIKINQGYSDSDFCYTGRCKPYVYSIEELKKEKGNIEFALESVAFTDEVPSKSFNLQLTISETESLKPKEKCIICEKIIDLNLMNDHVKNCKSSEASRTTFSKENFMTCLITKPEEYHLMYVTDIETHFLCRSIHEGNKIFFCAQYLRKDQENAGRFKYRIKINQGLPDFFVCYSGISIPYIHSAAGTKKQKGTIELDLKSIFLTDDILSSKKYELAITFIEMNDPHNSENLKLVTQKSSPTRVGPKRKTKDNKATEAKCNCRKKLKIA